MKGKGSKSKDKTKTVYAVFSIFVLVLLIATSFSSALTRIITGNSDNIETFIRNSTGKVYPATATGLQDAIDNSTSGGKVWVPQSFISTSLDINIRNDVTVIGTGTGVRLDTDIGTCINLTGNAHVNITDGRLHDVQINAEAGWTGEAALVIEGDYYIWDRHYILNNVNVYNLEEGRTGTGVLFEAIGAGSAQECIALSHFGAFGVRGFKTGIIIDSQDSANGAYINGNSFDRIIIANCTYGLNISESDGGQTQFNKFYSIDIQPNKNGISGNTKTGINIDDADKNYFFHVTFWDWAALGIGDSFNFDSNVKDTIITCNLVDGTYTDDADDTIITDILTGAIYSAEVQSKEFIVEYDGIAATDGFVNNDTALFQKEIYINNSEWSGDEWMIRHNADDASDDYGLKFQYGSDTVLLLDNVANYWNLAYLDTDFRIYGTNKDIPFKVNAGTNTVEMTNTTITDIFKLTPRDSAPSSSSAGMVYSDTDGHIYHYNGSFWNQLDN